MNNYDLIQLNETNQNSKGGTELLQERLYDGSVPRILLEQFQIVFSRLRELEEDKFRIFYAHDLPGDPESAFLANGGWSKFHKIVFVSNWQMQQYIQFYKIPWSMCFVIPNSIVPIELEVDQNGPVKFQSTPETLKLIYTPTPHRGLNILYPVFDKLSQKHNIELDVYSSFKLYGWEERDTEYNELFSALREHPKINYHGTASNQEVRDALVSSNIFAYPSVWPETSCLCLIEAMSAGLVCVHSDLAALYETSRNNTMMYHFDEDINRHATMFYGVLDHTITNFDRIRRSGMIHQQKIDVDRIHSWSYRSMDWVSLMNLIVEENPRKELSSGVFSYSAS